MNIIDALYSIFDSYFKSRGIEVYSQTAKVVSVDESNHTCEIELDKGGKRKNVRRYAKLSAGKGFIIIPVVGSKVIVSFLDSETCYIANYSEIDKVIFDGGGNAGIVKIKELEANLKSLKAYCEEINKALPAAFSAIGASMQANGASGAASYNASMAGKIITMKNMENPKFKH
jgi:hypothetical protein